MATTSEGTIKLGDKSLYTKSWLPDGPTKANLVFIHGFSDHMGRYYGFFPSLAERGIAVHGFDQRGWGRSVTKPSEKGLTGPTSQVIADVVAFLTPHLPQSPADPPVFVLGHSMGGGEVLVLASDPAYESLVSRVRGWLLEGPFLGFSPEEQPSWLTVASGRLAAKVLPRFQLHHPLKPENVSRDPAVRESVVNDALCHDTGTLESLAHFLDRTMALGKGEIRLTKAVRSLWIGHGSKDKVANPETCKRYFAESCGAVPDKTLKMYEGMYHMLHADGPESETFYKDVGDWILARAGPEEPGKTVEIGAKL